MKIKVTILLRDFNGTWWELAGSREEVYKELIEEVDKDCDAEEEIMLVSVDGMMIYNSLSMDPISFEDLVAFFA